MNVFLRKLLIYAIIIGDIEIIKWLHNRCNYYSYREMILTQLNLVI